ncbi:MAG: hypothetical protein R3B60_01340 [Candidatus Paceibacterota bacterium]
MENLKFKEEPLKNKAKLSGRERVSIEEALAIQSKLREYMTPPELASYLKSDPDLLNSLILRWIDKYAARFKDYCNLNADNDILMHKITHK